MKKFKGKVWGYRGDGYPMAESDETKYCIILTEYKIRPEIGDEVEFELIVKHGNIANARRTDDQ